MRLKLQSYDINVIYKPGPQMYISDTLSRVAIPIRTSEDTDSDYLIFQIREEDENRADIETVDMESNLFCVRRTTARNKTMFLVRCNNANTDEHNYERLAR